VPYVEIIFDTDCFAPHHAIEMAGQLSPRLTHWRG
jgi:hypothetical protein